MGRRDHKFEDGNRRYFEALDQTHKDPSKCLCKGSGWFRPPGNIWSRCPWHGKGVPKPESEEEVGG